MEYTYAAVIGKKDLGSQVIGYILNAPKSLKSIELAGDYTIGGKAVNVTMHKVSHSKANIKKAKMTQPVSFHAKSGTYTFFPVNS